MNDDKTRWMTASVTWLIDAANGETVALVLGSRHLKAHKTRLIAAAPEMYQLIENVAAAYDHDKSSHDLAATLYELRCKALQLLEKLEEGGME